MADAQDQIDDFVESEINAEVWAALPLSKRQAFTAKAHVALKTLPTASKTELFSKLHLLLLDVRSPSSSIVSLSIDTVSDEDDEDEGDDKSEPEKAATASRAMVVQFKALQKSGWFSSGDLSGVVEKLQPYITRYSAVGEPHYFQSLSRAEAANVLHRWLKFEPMLTTELKQLEVSFSFVSFFLFVCTMLLFVCTC
jgi:hypothetical protein